MPTLADLACYTKAVVHNCPDDAKQFLGLQIDSRKVVAGDVFVAIDAARDGHDFVQSAVEKGAIAALVERKLALDVPQIVVSDSIAAMAQFAKAWRMTMSAPVIALTGSAGKTTTKELMAAILATHFVGKEVLATAGNLNNELGVPMTLARLSGDQAAAVIEMGANHHGEIEMLTQMVQPTVGLITNAGSAHLEGFGSRDGVAQAKGEIYQQLADDATAVVNADSPYLPMWQEWIGARKQLSFGLQAGDFALEQSKGIESDKNGVTFSMVTPDGTYLVRLPLSGEHNVANALAAAACCYAVGVTVENIVLGLARATGAPGRMQKVATPMGCLVDDTYNANPESVKAAARWLAKQTANTLVLGDMAELGENATELHAEMGAYAKEVGVQRLICVGENAEQTAQAFGAHGLACDSVDVATEELLRVWSKDSTVLVKGSRAARMERVIKQLQKKMGCM